MATLTAETLALETLALETVGLGKTYRLSLLGRRRAALQDLSLHVLRGEVFGYLGPNGSGKTTTIKILLGLVFPDTGSATVLGRPLADRSWRYRVGYLPENPYFYDYLTAGEYLDYVGRLLGLPRSLRRDRAQHLVELVGIARSFDVPLRRFSKGMAQRLGIAQALMNDPELVILDEPMSGLDPIGRRLVRDVILRLKAQGKTVFFSTHILPDAETLCDRVAVLRGGCLLKTGRLDEILNLDVAHMEVLIGGGPEGGLDGLPPGVIGRHAMGERWRLEVEEAALVPVLQALASGGRRVLSVQPVRQSLEDYFFKEMGGMEDAGWGMED